MKILTPVVEFGPIEGDRFMSIHPTAIIDPKAEIDAEVDIGPYVVIEGPVRIKRGNASHGACLFGGLDGDRRK